MVGFDKARREYAQGLSATTMRGHPARRMYQTHTNSDLQTLLRRNEHQSRLDVETENVGFVASSMTIRFGSRTIARSFSEYSKIRDTRIERRI